MSDNSPGQQDAPAYEPPDDQRPASAAPIKLDYATPGNPLQADPLERRDPYAALRYSEYVIFSLGWMFAVVGSQINQDLYLWYI